MENIVIIAVLVVIVGLAALYIYKAKKSGKKCIGCPDGGTCGSDNGGCGCGTCNGSCCGTSSEKTQK